jgi:hypothetical protein
MTDPFDSFANLISLKKVSRPVPPTPGVTVIQASAPPRPSYCCTLLVLVVSLNSVTTASSFLYHPQQSNTITMQGGDQQSYTRPPPSRGPTPVVNAGAPVYSIDFGAQAAGKRIATTKRRVRWYVHLVICDMM